MYHDHAASSRSEGTARDRGTGTRDKLPTGPIVERHKHKEHARKLNTGAKVEHRSEKKHGRCREAWARSTNTGALKQDELED